MGVTWFTQASNPSRLKNISSWYHPFHANGNSKTNQSHISTTLCVHIRHPLLTEYAVNKRSHSLLKVSAIVSPFLLMSHGVDCGGGIKEPCLSSVTSNPAIPLEGLEALLFRSVSRIEMTRCSLQHVLNVGHNSNLLPT